MECGSVWEVVKIILVVTGTVNGILWSVVGTLVVVGWCERRGWLPG